MVPKLHAKGKSFKGVAAYLLHDKDRAKTAERLAWTETRNLATENPNVAWKIMAATAMDQERLKEQAGVKKTGRKSFDSVLHFTLSWHPEEKENLSREEMMRAANGAIRALQAADRQAMIVCHDDEPQPHVHVVINRISSLDGRMLSSSKEKLALSAWAEAYEKERGVIFCEERVLNNEARRRGEYSRGRKDEARKVIEALGPAANDNDRQNALRQEQRKKDAAIAKKSRAVKELHKRAWANLEREHKAGVRAIKAQAAGDRAAAISAVREKRRPDWTLLFHENQAALRAFEKREATLLGKIKNVWTTIDLKAIIHGRTDPDNPRRRGEALKEAFEIPSSKGKRLEALKRQQLIEAQKLRALQGREEEQAIKSVRAAQAEALEEHRRRYEEARNDLILAQSMDAAKLRAERLERDKQRERAWDEMRSGGREAQPAAEIKPEPTQEKSHAPDRFERGDSVRDRFERSSGDRFERGPGRDRGGRD